MIGLGNNIFRRNFTALGDSGNVGDFLVRDDGCQFVLSSGERMITSVDVDHIVTDTLDTLQTSDGDRLITYEV